MGYAKNFASTPDGGIAYQGTYSAPSYNGTTSAISTGNFQAVFGTGDLVFGTGLKSDSVSGQPGECADASHCWIAGFPGL